MWGIWKKNKYCKALFPIYISMFLSEKEGLSWLTGQGYSSSLWKPQGKELGVDSHIAFVSRSRVMSAQAGLHFKASTILNSKSTLCKW